MTWTSEEQRIDLMMLSGGRNACLFCGGTSDRGCRGLTEVASIWQIGREAVHDVAVVYATGGQSP